MNKIILFLIFLFSFPILTFAQTTDNICKYENMEFSYPTVKKNSKLLCRNGYVLDYSLDNKIPIWAFYYLDKDKALGCHNRSTFQEDSDIPEIYRSHIYDFKKTGFDIGHNVNAADMAYSLITDRESFLLSNMSPQLPGFNRGIWKRLETYVRNVSINNRLIIYVGNIYTKDSDKTGLSKVTIPDSMFKIIVNLDTKESLSFIIPHLENINNLSEYIVNVQTISDVTNINFNIPESYINRKSMWNFKNISRSELKKEVCNIN